MLAGSPPFVGSSVEAILMRHLNEPAPDVRGLRPDVPIAVGRVIAKVLSKDPADRFVTAASFAVALEEARAAHVHGVDRGTSRLFVAVLPFDNLSADPENAYFADGMTEDIIAQLSKVGGLRVMSRTSTTRLKQQGTAVSNLGEEFGVSHVLEGSVRRAGSRLRVVAQLIDARNDEHLWAETYDRQMIDVFEIQTEVAEQIAAKLQARLSTTDRVRLSKKPTNDLEAYNLFLLGRHHFNKI